MYNYSTFIYNFFILLNNNLYYNNHVIIYIYIFNFLKDNSVSMDYEVKIMLLGIIYNSYNCRGL